MTGPAQERASEPTRLRGGAGRGFGRGTWPLGKCEIANDYIEVTAPFGHRRATRHEVARVLIRRRRFHAIELVVERADGTTATPPYYPTSADPLIDALASHGWPIEIHVFQPRVHPVIWIAVAGVITVGASAEAFVQTARADRLTRRSRTTVAQITSIATDGDKPRAVATYIVGGETFSTSMTVTLDKDPGDQITLRYLPESPTHPWENGDDPPGTSNWWLGPLVPVAGLVALGSNQARKLRRRAGATSEHPIGS